MDRVIKLKEEMDQEKEPVSPDMSSNIMKFLSGATFTEKVLPKNSEREGFELGTV